MESGEFRAGCFLVGVIPAEAGIHLDLAGAGKQMDYTRLLSRARRAIRFANVPSGILPSQSRFRGNDG
jgi:hypothetical protein